MENQEIMTSNEVNDIVETVADSGDGFKILAGIGIVAVVGFAAYKGYILIRDKIKANKEPVNRCTVVKPIEVENDEEETE